MSVQVALGGTIAHVGSVELAMTWAHPWRWIFFIWILEVVMLWVVEREGSVDTSRWCAAIVAPSGAAPFFWLQE